jgi:hypothetical protein
MSTKERRRMQTAEIPLSALCEGLGIPVQTFYKWGQRKIVEMEPFKPRVERKFDSKFAFRLAAFHKLSNVSIPLPEAWQFTDELIGYLGTIHVPEDQPVFIIYPLVAGRKSDPRVMVGVKDMLTIVEEAVTKGWPRVVVVEIGAALRQARHIMNTYGQEVPEDARERLSA